MWDPTTRRPLFDEADDRGPFEDRTPTHVEKMPTLLKDTPRNHVRIA
jgi:hypothetical protein